MIEIRPARMSYIGEFSQVYDNEKRMYFSAYSTCSSLPVGRQAERVRDGLLEIGSN
jgi:hypothetical protein